jgi:hypothetical protein
VFLLLLTALVAVPVALVARASRRKKPVYAGGRARWKYPLTCMFHPIDGFADLKDEKSGSKGLAAILLLLFFAVCVIGRRLTGFAFNPIRTDRLNIGVVFISTVGLLVIFAVCNWAVTTISDGKGRLQEIIIFLAYALLPYILLTPVAVLLSNMLTLSDGAFYTAIRYISFGWSGLNAVLALREVHSFSLKKTLLTLLLTGLGLLVVVVIAAILYSVAGQFISFFTAIVTEITL